MNECCFIADVAVLPSWLRVDHAIDFVAGVHPRFRRDRAIAFLAKTQITGNRRMRELSKGMKTQVHLALTMAIDAKLLVLDEPTLGLDILARRAFYDALVNDYMDETRTILITTHQVEEVENLLTDIVFIDKGRIVLDSSLEDVATRFAAVAVTADRLDAARAEKPFYERHILGKVVLYFENVDPGKLEGSWRNPHPQRFRSFRREAFGRCSVNNSKWLIRREFWENRAIWMIPAVFGGLLLLAALFGQVSIPRLTSPQESEEAAAAFLVIVGAMFYLVMGVYSTWYLLDCLYTDRKDRSILFWKSLPISDATTVLCKLLVGMVIIPLVYFAAADATALIAAFILSIRARASIGSSLWNGDVWWQVQVLWIYAIVTTAVWYLPVAGWLMLVSA